MKLGEEVFARIVQVMVKRQNADAAKVWSPDGRGGDGGIDVAVQNGDGLHVYQIKFFTDGFSGDRATTRKKQIKKSFNKACELNPRPMRWSLVVPKHLTPGERLFVEGLAAADGRTPTIAIVDPDDLDDLIATMPDVYQYLVRDPLADVMDQYHIERGPLIESEADLSARIGGLGEQASSLNPNYGLDVHYVDGGISYGLRPKHPWAADDDPVTVRVQTSFGPDDTAEHEAFRRSLLFGARGSVHLPGRVVSRAVIESSHPVFNDDLKNPELVLTSHSISGPREVEFRFEDSTGSTVASYDGVLDHAGRGPGGISAAFRILDRIELDVDFAYRDDADADQLLEAAGPLRLHYSLADTYPDDAVRIVEFLTLLASDALRCRVLIDGSATFAFTAAVQLDNDLAIIGSAAYDLSRIQEQVRQRFKLPTELTPWLRINMRVARALLEGYVMQSPRAATLTIETHADTDPEEVQRWLTDAEPFQAPMDGFALEVDGRTIPIDGVRAFTARGKVVNADDVAAALRNEQMEGLSVQIQPADHRYFLLYKEDRVPSDQSPVQQAWWSLPGIDQPGEPRELSEDETPSGENPSSST